MKAVIIDEMVENAGCSGWRWSTSRRRSPSRPTHDGTRRRSAQQARRVDAAEPRGHRGRGPAGGHPDLQPFGAHPKPGHGLMFWEGDLATTWDRYDGIRIGPARPDQRRLSGLALNRSDTGGYTSLSRFGLGYSRPGELLKRWGEMSAFTSLLRTHEGNQPRRTRRSTTRTSASTSPGRARCLQGWASIGQRCSKKRRPTAGPSFGTCGSTTLTTSWLTRATTSSCSETAFWWPPCSSGAASCPGAPAPATSTCPREPGRTCGPATSSMARPPCVWTRP